MRESPWKAIKVAIGTFTFLAMLLLFVLPLGVSQWLQTKPEPPPGILRYLRWLENCQRLSIQILAGGYFFVVGSCFASFLNVVAARVPRGQSITGHSRCPQCLTRLRLRDNLPIIGWLRHQGQCRYCQAPIASRYLNVEILLGTVFLVLGLSTLATGGVTLPVRHQNPGMGFERFLLQPKWDLLQILMGQICLLLFLFTFALIELERFRIPRSLLLAGFFCGFAMATCNPSMILIEYAWPLQEKWPMAWGSYSLLGTLLIGVLIGALLGRILNRCLGSRLIEHLYLANVANQKEDELETHGSDRQLTLGPDLGNSSNPATKTFPANGDPSQTMPGKVTSSFFCGLVLCGLFLGWQSAVIISIWVALIYFIFGGKFQRETSPWFTNSSLVFIGCLLHLMTWRWLNLLTN